MGVKATNPRGNRPSASSAGDHHPARSVTETLTTVSGDRKIRSRSRASSALPTKRSSRPVGKASVATGGMKRAQAACHSGVCGNCSRHHWPQRAKVRRGIPNDRDSRAAAGFCPACRAEPSTTANPRYTRRPKKRTDIDVERLRHQPQQKLKRVSYSPRTAGGQPRGFRG